MGDDKDKSPLIPVSVIAVMLAALGATMFVQPFKSSRPFVPEYRESYQKINARLWQDPFQAVLDSVKANPQTTIAAGQVDIGKDVRKKPLFSSPYLKTIEHARRVTVLAVMVPGGSYSEDTEGRLRFRYALLSGLNRVGFSSDDDTHVEFIRLGSKDTTITLSTIVPVEWLEQGEWVLGGNGTMERENDYVLVLWINEDTFGGDPLPKLGRFFAYLKESDKLRSASFKIIGPATSGTLLNMVREVFDGKTASWTRPLKGAEIYSAMATADNKRLLKDATGAELCENPAHDEIVKTFLHHEIKLTRTIGTDGRLVNELMRELRFRGVDLRIRHNHLLLIAEWDTYYARVIEDLLNTAVNEATENSDAPDDETGGRVHRISYLRGIDGSLPGEKEEKNNNNGNAAAKNDPRSDLKKLEQPVGKSQYDYLRRLAEATRDLNEKLRATEAPGEIRAIGVMGSDFYDKYLVLQALRPEFPDAVFFTTDLDARFLHPDNIKWTRNLIVASNFNLSLRRDETVNLQGVAPPFRDNYQTSLFLAVLLAFNDKRSYLSEDVRDRLVQNGLKPLVFEIGRHKAVGLTDIVDTVHPQRDEAEHNAWFYVKIVLIIILGLVVIFFVSTPVNTFVKRSLHTKAKYGIISLALAVFLAAYAVHQISRRPGEEPFSVLEGISVWPTEILRLLAFVLSVLFLYLSRRNLKKNRDQIVKEFGFKGEPDRPSQHSDAKTRHRKHNRRWWHMVMELDWTPETAKQGTRLRDVWLDYVSRDLDRYRIVRVAIIFFFFWLLCGLILSFDWPVSPARGRYTSAIDKFLSFVSPVFLVVLIFYVFDVTRCCRRFIKHLLSDEMSVLHQSGGKEQDQIKNDLDLIRLIAMRTDTVGKFIFYPFIVWLIIFIARFDYFDNWTTPPGLAVVISLGAALAWSSGFLLRQSAERARTRAMDRLMDLLHTEKAKENPNTATINYIEFVLDAVRSIRQGAFAPFTQHPVVRSLLVPFGGVGGVYLVDFLAKMNF